MKKRVVLAGILAVVVIAAAGALFTLHYWSRMICWAGHAPDRIAGFQQGETITATLAELPSRDPWRTDPPVVLDLPTVGFCPSVDPYGYVPMVIWVRVADDRFVSYERGGGP